MAKLAKAAPALTLSTPAGPAGLPTSCPKCKKATPVIGWGGWHRYALMHPDTPTYGCRSCGHVLTLGAAGV